MRILAFGDIHGYVTALDALLAAVAPKPEDSLVFLGDYVDRGPDSRGAIDRVMELEKTRRAITLRGNHEQMMMDSRAAPGLLPNWLLNGGTQTLASYRTKPDREGDLLDVPRAHWNFLDHTCVDWFEAGEFFFVHAGVIPTLGLSQQPAEVLRWQKLTPRSQPHFSGKTMVCGHTVQASGLPLDLGFAICIDTGIYLPDGRLTCLDVETGNYWQADQAGNIRTGDLDSDAEAREEAEGY
ncbi:MAG: serine/threonine protein phosphatase [Planctomycetia bacterium]|nr:serine/threonine protein phosphatase [Planctomycetia bacterium]